MSYENATSPWRKLTCKVLSQQARIIKYHAEQLLSCVLHFTGTEKIRIIISTTTQRTNKGIFCRNLKGEVGQE